MAQEETLHKMTARQGQSQGERHPKALGAHFADLDERTPEAFFLFTQNFSKLVQYYRGTINPSDPPPDPMPDWSRFFEYDLSTLPGKNGGTPPHLALFLAFLELYKTPQEVMNRITGRHLDFYYQSVLRLQERGALADRAHIVIALKKNASPIEISQEQLFSAGKDATGVELFYAPTGTTVMNLAKVASLHSFFLDKAGEGGHGVVRYASVANSSDGIGGALVADDPKWHGFGHAELPSGDVGFALASPVLLMTEGTRTVNATLILANVDPEKLSDASLNGAFEAFLTGEKGWLGPYTLSPTLSSSSALLFTLIVQDTGAVIAYDVALHGGTYATTAPILKLLLKPNLNIGYNDFSGVTLTKAEIEVTVSGVTSLALENDTGILDPQKPFLPFSAQPTAGSRFWMGYEEAFSKKLSQIEAKIVWKDVPPSLSTHYTGYGTPLDNNGQSVGNNKYFTAAVIFQENGRGIGGGSVKLFHASDATLEQTFSFTGGTIASQTIDAIIFSLEKSFLHSTYRKKHVENLVTYSKEGGTLLLLNEPYTPVVQTIQLSYNAFSGEVDIESGDLDDNLQFFHLTPFGSMREQGVLRNALTFLGNKKVSLLPSFDHEGELLIGFGDLDAGASVNVLFQVAEGSADPDLPQATIVWFVLCGNYWKPLGTREVLLDTTDQLLTSGTLQFIVPTEATRSNTILPADRIWIKGAIQENVTAVCQLIEVAANAIEVRFSDNGNDPNHLKTALPAKRIAKMTNKPSAVQTITQPYGSFGGRPIEQERSFRTRVSERLRHKNRCITAWDYERVILEAFPHIHQVKCIPHATDGETDGDWLAPGQVLIVLIPNLANKNAMDPLQPKVDARTLSQVSAHLERRTGMRVGVKVKNPSYQKIQVDFKVRFHPGYEFNYYSEQLKQKLVAFLSPWAYDASRTLSFGGRVYRSVLLDFVEEVEYVDYVTDFKMYTYRDVNPGMDVPEARPDRPDAILVSETTHTIGEVEG